MGPYRLDQLQIMWLQGQLTSDTYYYDEGRAEWLLLGALIDRASPLFTVAEAFLRLGQNRQTGCLSVHNQMAAIDLFVEDGFVVCALGDKDHGEFALSRALSLENSAYTWFSDAKPPDTNLRVNITEYAFKHSLNRETKIESEAPRKQSTVALPKIGRNPDGVKLNFNYLLARKGYSKEVIRLVKTINLLGREEHCDVVIKDDQVSGKHCLLEVTEQNLKVSDLDSRNGTYVNGVPIKKGLLNVGDSLDLGNLGFILKKEPKKAPDLN